jgi:hypothetical protein
MCNLYSITTNQAAIIALFPVMNRDAAAQTRAIHEAGARRHEPALASIQQQKLATDREAVTLSFAS